MKDKSGNELTSNPPNMAVGLSFPTILSSFSHPKQKKSKNPLSSSASRTNSLIHLLKSCPSIREFSLIHAQLITTNIIHDPFVASHVLWYFIYVKKLEHARQIFNRSHVRETKIWNTLMENQLTEGSESEVFLTYCHMVAEGVPVDVSTCHFLIHACSRVLSFRQGQEVHCRVLKCGFGGNRSLNNNLMGLYKKCSRYEDACKMFEKMPDRNVISWNTMVSCCVQVGMPEKAFDIFWEMKDHGIRMDNITMISLVSACVKARDLNMGEELHLHMEENEMDINGNLLNCLVDMYMKCGKMEKAHEVLKKSNFEIDVVLGTTMVGGYLNSGEIKTARNLFNQITGKNLISFMVMISGYVKEGCYYESLDLFQQMRVENVEPDETVLVPALSACAHVQECKLGTSIHCLIVKYGMLIDGFLGNSLIDMYGKCGKLHEAYVLFKNLLSKNIVSWNSMLEGFCRSGDIKKTRAFFDEIPEKDVISWNTMMNFYAKSMKFTELFELFQKMQNSPVKPDKLTLVSLLASCASTGALNHGTWVHVYLKKNNMDLDPILGTALIDMYGKCGNIEKASELFSQMIEKKNVFVWTAMIGAHAMEGQAEKAISLFLEMEANSIKPDHVTFTSLLSACSHGGLVEEGYKLYNNMSSKYKIVPKIQHYGCMVDLLARSGRINAAVEFIKTMPIEPDISIWSALMRASCGYQNVKFAEFAFKRAIEIDPLNDAVYGLISNIYTRVGRWDDARWARKRWYELGIRKQLGCSIIEVNGVVHEFTCADLSNPKSEEIHSFLNNVAGQLKRQEGEESSSFYHSERLAVAFGLISNSGMTSIRVINNVRICDCCHSFMKLVSKTYDGQIVIRDNYRFHRFQDGHCSCKDYW